MKNIVAIILLLPLIPCSLAQTETEGQSEKSPTPPSIGIGAGLDYGGIGIKASVSAVDHLAFFISAGHNGDRFTLGGGSTFRIVPGHTVVPVLQTVYGYNAIVGSGVGKKTYYGLSAGGGIEIHLFRHGFFNIGVNYALLRSNAYKENVSRSGNAANDRTIISAGCHFEF